MKLPNYLEAIVPKAKIVDCLLSLEHPDGSGKAIFFHRYDFSEVRWDVMADALREHAGKYEVKKTESTPFGERFIIEGQLRTPSGRTPWVRVVWFIDIGADIPRLVTSCPVEERDND